MSRKHKKSARSQRNKRQAFQTLFQKPAEWYENKAGKLGMKNPDLIKELDPSTRSKVISKLESLDVWKRKQKELAEYRAWLEKQGVELAS